MLKASLLTFPMFVLILLGVPAFVYAQDMHATPKTSVVTSDAQGIEQQEPDEEDIDQADNTPNLQEVEMQKKSPVLKHKKHDVIANSNGDSIPDTGNDDSGN